MTFCRFLYAQEISDIVIKGNVNVKEKTIINDIVCVHSLEMRLQALVGVQSR